MPTPIVYFKTEWMDYYDGRKGDVAPGNFGYVAENGEAHEDHNFLEVNGRNYAYAPIAGGGGGVGIHQLGVAKTAEYVDGIDLIFIAKGPRDRGVVVVGWYRNARVYRTIQRRGRRIFNAECASADAFRIPSDERWLRIAEPPRRSNVWYGRPEIDRAVRRLMAGTAASRKPAPKSVTHDAERCLLVERAAYEATIALFRERGFKMKDVTRDNVGWDLEARRGNTTLLLEVKGTEQSELRAELTPNEYAQSALHPEYRVCIVTDALLKTPNAYVFKPELHPEKPDEQRWFDETGAIELIFTPRTAARLSARPVAE